MNIQGLSTSKGLAVGTAFLYKKTVPTIKPDKIENRDTEWQHYQAVLSETEIQLKQMVEKTKINIGEKESKIFEAHIMMLQDEMLQEPIKEMILESGWNASYAVNETIQSTRKIFLEMENEYMRERAADLSDLGQRLIRNIQGIKNDLDLPLNAILFCEDLEPSDTAMLDPKTVAGFVTEKGGKTSHSAIIAQSIGIPAITGICPKHHGIENGQMIILDALEGTLVVDPSEELLKSFKEKQEMFLNDSSKFEVLKHEKALTKDGHHVEVAANIADSNKAPKAIEQGAEGVGLFRTEFLYMNRESLPSVKEQFKAYKMALETFGEKPMVIRTFDIGGDKHVDYLNLETEMNPFLGYRAIRISLDRKRMFMDQLKALYMASVYGNLKIMFPMIATIDEIKQIKGIIKEVHAELDAEAIPYKEVELGIMVEIPVVAVEAEKFAEHVDFFSIGTNDLLQYTVAVDRMNEKLSYLYNWYHPGLLRMINMVAKAANKAGIWVGICGEAAADPLLLPFYVGSGIHELSMSGSKVAEIKWHLSQLSHKNCLEIPEAVLSLDTADEVVEFLKAIPR